MLPPQQHTSSELTFTVDNRPTHSYDKPCCACCGITRAGHQVGVGEEGTCRSNPKGTANRPHKGLEFRVCFGKDSPHLGPIFTCRTPSPPSPHTPLRGPAPPPTCIFYSFASFPLWRCSATGTGPWPGCRTLADACLAAKAKTAAYRVPRARECQTERRKEKKSTRTRGP